MRLPPALVDRFAAAARHPRARAAADLRMRRPHRPPGGPRARRAPGSTAEVQAVVRICNDADIPFVARGAGTGLSGGALPVAEGIVISLARMDRVLSVDLDRGEVVVEPGVTNLDVTRAVADDGFYYAPDPSSQQVCTIGGNVAENSGGAHCLKYGFTVNHVLAAEIVLPDGELVELVGLGRRPRPARRLRRLRGDARDRDETDAARPAGARRRCGRCSPASSTPTAQARRSPATIAARHPPGGDRDDGRDHDRGGGGSGRCRLSAGLRRGADHRARRPSRRRSSTISPLVEELCRESGAVEIRLAVRPGRPRRRLAWAKGGVRRDGPRQPELLRPGRRRAAHEAPRGAAADRRTLARARPARRQRLPRRRRQPPSARALRRAHRRPGRSAPSCSPGRILEACVDAGGSITGEHGVGTDKACAMPLMFGEADLEVMQRVRPGFDPARAREPGQGLPDAAALRRGARPVPGPPARAGRPCRALLSRGSSSTSPATSPASSTAACGSRPCRRARPARATALTRPAGRPDARRVPRRRPLRAAAPPLRDDARPRDRRQRRAAGRNARHTPAARS